MAKYVLVFHGAQRPQAESELARIISSWNQWLGSLGRAVVDGGGPFSQARYVTASEATEPAQHEHPSGYSILEATSMDEAVAMAQSCPVLKMGGSIEVCEAFQIG
jgi:hypothetical protein